MHEYYTNFLHYNLFHMFIDEPTYRTAFIDLVLGPFRPKCFKIAIKIKSTTGITERSIYNI